MTEPHAPPAGTFYTTRRDEGATGLGLHIVYNILTHRLGGKLTLESAAGQGTRYQLILPKIAPL
jgi:signal transduction histidine kinase